MNNIVHFYVLADPTLTVDNVIGVMEIVAVERRKRVWSSWDFVPKRQLEKIYHKYLTEEQRMRACADFYVNENPQSSWKELCEGLFTMKEMPAVRRAKTFISQTGKICSQQQFNDVEAHCCICIIDLKRRFGTMIS